MEEKYVVTVILTTITTIVAVAVSILFLYTIRNIEMQTLISESAQIKEVKDVDYLHSNTKLVTDVLK
jgi:recombinational DNA repair protein RecT